MKINISFSSSSFKASPSSFSFTPSKSPEEKAFQIQQSESGLETLQGFIVQCKIELQKKGSFMYSTIKTETIQLKRKPKPSCTSSDISISPSESVYNIFDDRSTTLSIKVECAHLGSPYAQLESSDAFIVSTPPKASLSQKKKGYAYQGSFQLKVHEGAEVVNKEKKVFKLKVDGSKEKEVEFCFNLSPYVVTVSPSPVKLIQGAKTKMSLEMKKKYKPGVKVKMTATNKKNSYQVTNQFALTANIWSGYSSTPYYLDVDLKNYSIGDQVEFKFEYVGLSGKVASIFEPVSSFTSEVVNPPKIAFKYEESTLSIPMDKKKKVKISLDKTETKARNNGQYLSSLLVKCELEVENSEPGCLSIYDGSGKLKLEKVELPEGAQNTYINVALDGSSCKVDKEYELSLKTSQGQYYLNTSSSPLKLEVTATKPPPMVVYTNISGAKTSSSKKNDKVYIVGSKKKYSAKLYLSDKPNARYKQASEIKVALSSSDPVVTFSPSNFVLSASNMSKSYSVVVGDSSNETKNCAIEYKITPEADYVVAASTALEVVPKPKGFFEVEGPSKVALRAGEFKVSVKISSCPSTLDKKGRVELRIRSNDLVFIKEPLVWAESPSFSEMLSHRCSTIFSKSLEVKINQSADFKGESKQAVLSWELAGGSAEQYDPPMDFSLNIILGQVSSFDLSVFPSRLDFTNADSAEKKKPVAIQLTEPFDMDLKLQLSAKNVVFKPSALDFKKGQKTSEQKEVSYSIDCAGVLKDIKANGETGTDSSIHIHATVFPDMSDYTNFVIPSSVSISVTCPKDGSGGDDRKDGGDEDKKDKDDDKDKSEEGGKFSFENIKKWIIKNKLIAGLAVLVLILLIVFMTNRKKAGRGQMAQQQYWNSNPGYYGYY